MPSKKKRYTNAPELEEPEAEVLPTVLRSTPLFPAAPEVDPEAVPTFDIKPAIYAATHPHVYKTAHQWILDLKNDEIPSTDALALHLGISHKRLDKFRESNGNLDELCLLIETASRERLRVAALQGKVTPQIAALVMKHLGYTERVDITSKGQSMAAPPLTDEQRRLLSKPPTA